MIEQWKTVADQEPDAARRATYRGLALVFTGLAGRLPAWEKALEDRNMLESLVIAVWREQDGGQAVILAGSAACEVSATRFRRPGGDGGG